jgi:hypothetical protein
MDFREISIASACCLLIGDGLLKATNVPPFGQSALLLPVVYRSPILGDVERAFWCLSYREWAKVAKDRFASMEAFCRDL